MHILQLQMSDSQNYILQLYYVSVVSFVALGGNIRETVEFAKERKQLDQKLVTLSVFVSKEYFDEVRILGIIH